MPGMDNGHALVVGIADYKHVNKLPSVVVNDAQDIYNLLIDPQYCGYQSDNVQLLLDEQATLVKMRQALVELASRSDENSTVFIYLSSHGGQIESGPYAGEYLLLVDTTCTSEESIAQTAISGTQFTETLRAVPARKLVVIFDCCHAGGLGQPKNLVESVLKVGLSESYYEALQAGQGRVIIASSRSTEVSWILPGAKNSLFTQHMLAGLRGEAAGTDGFVRIFDLFNYLQPKVTADQPAQHPVFKAEIEENFTIALYRASAFGFLDKIGYSGSKRYGEIDEVYVPPLEYADIKETLKEKRVVFITGTQEYGKTFTAVRLMWEYYNRGYEPKWIKGGELSERIQVRERLENIEVELKPKHIVYFEDPFGKTKYEKREGLERVIGTILEYVKQVEDVYVIITSREEVFKEFEKEKLSVTQLREFEIKLNFKKPSYDYEKKKEILLTWATQRNCKWLGDEQLRDLVLNSINFENILPTPLSIHDFAISSREIENEDKIKQLLREKSKETGKVFANEVKNMTKDKILFLSFPLIWNRFEVVFVELVYKELVDELSLTSAWEFDRVLKWFKDDKINLREGKYLELSHPSYYQTLEHLLQEENYPTWVNKEIFGKLLLKLSEKEESAINSAWFMAWEFKKVAEVIRNKILLKLSEKDATAEYNAMALARNFDEVPESIRNEILLKSSEQAETAQYYVLSLVKNFDKVPENIRNEIMLGASEKENGLRWVPDILVNNLDKFSSNILSELISKISIKDDAYDKVAWAIVSNIKKLSEEVLRSSLLQFSDDDRTDWIVGSGIRGEFDNIPEDLRTELLLKLSKRDNSARHVIEAIKSNPNGISEDLRSRLLLILSARDDIAGTVAWFVKDNFESISQDIRNTLLLNFCRHDGATSFLSLTLQDNFDNIPESLRNKLLLELCVNNEAALTISFILKDNFNRIREEVRDKLLSTLSEKEVAIWVVWIINDHFNTISEDLRNRLLLKLSEKDETAEAVLLTVNGNINKLDVDLAKQVLDKLARSTNEKIAKEAKETQKSLSIIESARNLLEKYKISK